MLSDGAFTALLLLVSGVSAGTVLPPKNVTVKCENFSVTVSWEYSQQQPQTIFRVTIISSADVKNSVYDTTDHQLDLSDFIWASQDRYMGFHHVTVTAIQGGSQSVAVEGESFSFNDLKPSDITCKLVFPPVDLIETDAGATLTFKNPLRSYEKLRQTTELDAAFFSFSIVSDDGEFNKACDKGCDISCDDCSLKEEICKHDILFAEGTKKCVQLKGMLLDKKCVGQVLFNKTGLICASEPYEAPVILLVTLLSMTALIISILTVSICKAKAWTMRTPTTLPDPLITLPNQREKDLKFVNECDPDFSDVTLTRNKPCKMPSVSSEEENDPTDNYDRGSGSSSQPSACFYTDGKNLDGSNQETVGLMSEGNRTDDDSSDNSVKTECVSLNLEEEEEEKRSSYNCPHNLQVDKCDKDMVTAHSKT